MGRTKSIPVRKHCRQEDDVADDDGNRCAKLLTTTTTTTTTTTSQKKRRYPRRRRSEERAEKERNNLDFLDGDERNVEDDDDDERRIMGRTLLLGRRFENKKQRILEEAGTSSLDVRLAAELAEELEEQEQTYQQEQKKRSTRNSSSSIIASIEAQIQQREADFRQQQRTKPAKRKKSTKKKTNKKKKSVRFCDEAPNDNLLCTIIPPPELEFFRSTDYHTSDYSKDDDDDAEKYDKHNTTKTKHTTTTTKTTTKTRTTPEKPSTDPINVIYYNPRRRPLVFFDTRQQHQHLPTPPKTGTVLLFQSLPFPDTILYINDAAVPSHDDTDRGGDSGGGGDDVFKRDSTQPPGSNNNDDDDDDGGEIKNDKDNNNNTQSNRTTLLLPISTNLAVKDLMAQYYHHLIINNNLEQNQSNQQSSQLPQRQQKQKQLLLQDIKQQKQQPTQRRKNIPKPEDFVRALCSCLQEGWITIDLVVFVVGDSNNDDNNCCTSTNIQLRLSLTQHAIQESHRLATISSRPNQNIPVPHFLKRKQQQQKAASQLPPPVKAISTVLAAFFPSLQQQKQQPQQQIFSPASPITCTTATALGTGRMKTNNGNENRSTTTTAVPVVVLTDDDNENENEDKNECHEKLSTGKEANKEELGEKLLHNNNNNNENYENDDDDAVVLGDGGGGGGGTRIITAKQIYELTDNRQLLRVLEKEEKLLQEQQSEKNPPSHYNSSNKCYKQNSNKIVNNNIPGLVPTLRPYQRAAVEWMLQREHMMRKPKNETKIGMAPPHEEQQHKCGLDDNVQNDKEEKRRGDNDCDDEQEEEEDDEWKLAWLVLNNANNHERKHAVEEFDNTKEPRHATTTSTTMTTKTTTPPFLSSLSQPSTTISSSASCWLEGDAWPLLRDKSSCSSSLGKAYEKEEERQQHPTLLYCPFIGWLSTSLEDAKQLTLGIKDIGRDGTNGPSGKMTSTSTLNTKSKRISGLIDSGDGQDDDDEDDFDQENDCAMSQSRGGILAESMGLGKTVEILACIMAHRRNSATTAPAAKTAETTPIMTMTMTMTTTESSSPLLNQIQQSESARKPVFDYKVSKGDKQTDSESDSVETKQNENPKDKKPSVGFVTDDIGELGDSESISSSLGGGDDDNDKDDEKDDDSLYEDKETSSESAIGKPISRSPKRAMSRLREAATSNAIPVTPGEEQFDIEERWLDEDLLGSCICGRLISFSTTKKKEQGTILICQICNEPMHMACSAYDSIAELQPLNYRKTFSNKTLECRLCPDCPCCAAAQTPMESNATLIITPPAILNQWELEIQRHTRNADGQPLNVLVYDGIEKACKQPIWTRSNAMKMLHPGHLAKADIVLMTFSALMSDLAHSDDNRFIASAQLEEDSDYPKLRQRKRYRVVPSPLLSINWWRVCLDEAQRVETPTAGSARMALKLKAVHRWCVTGTPVGRGKLEDLYGLLLFLRIKPFSNKKWFNKCFNPAYPGVEERIEYLLRNIFWRSTKALDLVRQQMGVPDQVERKIVLHFSSIEKHFYNQQLEKTLAAVGDISERKNNSNKRKASQLEMLAEHLHRLRAACCHPQVGQHGVSGGVKKSKISSKQRESASSIVNSSLSTRVMTMEQILDRFIDDARLKCEESLRLANMHTNAMAAISRLKVEAKERGVTTISETNPCLLVSSGTLYLESISLSEEHGIPTLAIGEAVLTGSTGFCTPRAITRAGRGTMSWKFTSSKAAAEPWGVIEFEGPSRKLTQIRLRTVLEIPTEISNDTAGDFTWHLLRPKDCLFQVANMAVGGEFVDVASLTLPSDPGVEWVSKGGFRTNKSKSWRLVVKSFHDDHVKNLGSLCSTGVFLALEFEIYEADVASDSLQRLHSLHNGVISFEAALEEIDKDALEHALGSKYLTEDTVKTKIKSMKEEARLIESLYMEHSYSLHKACMDRFRELLTKREEEEVELLELSNQTKSRKDRAIDCWDDTWWDDFLGICRVYGSEQQQRSLFEKVVQDIEGTKFDGDTTERFPDFGDLSGLRTALLMRIEKVRIGLGKEGSRQSHTALRAASTEHKTSVFQLKSTKFKCPRGAHSKCMKAIAELTTNPDGAEIFENTHCKVCKADWFQTGPKCRHCKLGEELEDLVPDTITLNVLNILHAALRSQSGSAVLKAARTTAFVGERAKRFFDVIEAEKRERVGAWRMWRTHLDLLNDLDELNQCKSAMRLSYEGEDLSQLADDQLNALVIPMDIMSRYHDHAAKQAMALGDLRRAKDTLRFLKNQNVERTETETVESDEKETCVVCLFPFEEERAVLRCGHSFHHSPCLENLKKRSGNLITCPMRCRLRTDPKDVMFATNKARNDGSTSTREVKGSWGTKVTRLISDILDIRDLGEKCVVFSQWEDMLDIIMQALAENEVCLARSSSAKLIGEAIRQFRSPDCTVLLLNVKNGAEGLTLLEATHVFMVEPLLNYGLDSQAINRIHRIGQNRKTCVWRYLINDTIEGKIDKMRMEHQEDQVEDAISAGRKSTFRAGGIDGGFQSHEELLQVLQI